MLNGSQETVTQSVRSTKRSRLNKSKTKAKAKSTTAHMGRDLLLGFRHTIARRASPRMCVSWVWFGMLLAGPRAHHTRRPRPSSVTNWQQRLRSTHD